MISSPSPHRKCLRPPERHDISCKLLITMLALALTGCPVPIDSADGNADDPDPSSDLPIESPVVTVHFRNLTSNTAVDVEFFLTKEPVGTLPDDLLQEPFRRRAEIGVAGTGIIEPRTEDIVTIECGPHLILATAGGRFLDNDSGEQVGTGPARWVQESALGICGHSVAFDFLQTADAVFETRIRLVD